MSAYTPGFVKDLTAGSGSQVTGIELSLPAPIPAYEIMMAADEVVLTQDGDVVQQQVDSIQLVITATLLTAGEGGVSIPYVPETPPGDTAIIDDSTIYGVQWVEGYLVANAGSKVVVFKRVRPWSSGVITSGKFVVFESTDGGVNLVRRSAYTPPLSRYYLMQALRGSDGMYLSVQLEKAVVDAAPSIYVVAGVIGGSLGYTSYKWDNPYYPVVIACDGTKFVVITQKNRVYNSLDGITWTYIGVLAPAFPFELSSMPYSPYAMSWKVPLQWLPILGKWCLSWGGVESIYYTDDVTAQSGWSTPSLPPRVSIVGAVTTVLYYHLGDGVVEYAGALFTLGRKEITEAGITTNQYLVWKSTDAGASWTACMITNVIDIYDPHSPHQLLTRLGLLGTSLVCYTVSLTPHVWKSIDAGVTWAAYETNLDVTSFISVLAGGTKVMAVDNIAIGNPEFFYSSDGITFESCTEVI